MAITIGIGFSGGRSAADIEGGRVCGKRRGLGFRMSMHIVSTEWQKTVVRASMKMMKRMWNMRPPPLPDVARPR